MRIRAFRTLLLLALPLIAILSGRAETAHGWVSVKTANFHLAGDASEIQIKSVAERLEQFRDALSQVLPGLKFDTGIRTNVIVFKDSASYRAFKPKRPDGTPDEAVAGYFLSGEDVNYITLSAATDRGDPFRTINHEYVHFLLRSNFGDDIPAWLDEGLAEYFETLHISDPLHVAIGGSPSEHLKLLKERPLISLKTLLSTSGAAVHSRDDDSRNLFYAESWALIHFLINRDGVEKVISMVSANSNRTLGDIDENIEKALTSYINQAAIPTSTASVKLPPASSGASLAATLSDAEANAYLGDLLYHADRLNEAEPFLRTSLILDSNSALGHMSLGLLLMRKDNFREARKHLEFAIAQDKTNHLAYFNYAYAISRENEDHDGSISAYSDEDAAKMRVALLKAIELEPKFAESYRLLAFVDFVNDINLEEAASFLEKGLHLRPGDQDFIILLAKVELALEKYDEARKLAESLANASDADVRKDANEILKTMGQYTKARLEVKDRPSANLPWMQSLLFLKRSWLTEADLSKIDRDRDVNNLNRALGRPLPDEQQVLGRINNVSCSDGGISYDVVSDSKNLSFTSSGFQNLRMAVLLEGEHSFQIDCGVNFSKYLTVLNYRPSTDKNLNSKPQLTSITFVPDYFKLKSPVELSGIRAVVVEDDLLRRGRGAGAVEHINVDEQTRWSGIGENLRHPQSGETRVIGTLERVDCSGDTVNMTVLMGGKQLVLSSNSPKELKVSWFSVDASQVPLVCGSEPMMSNTLFTFIPNDAGGILKAIEFVPGGFIFPSKN